MIGTKTTDVAELRMAALPAISFESGQTSELTASTDWLQFPAAGSPPLITRQSHDILRI
jgi:hypothetical protein